MIDLKLASEQIRARMHDRRFVTAGNPHGVAGSDTVFHYFVEGAVIRGSYQGGRVLQGNLIGRVRDSETVELLYHCATVDDELFAGWSHGQVGVDGHGRTTLTFNWGWLSGAEGGGKSDYVEVEHSAKAAQTLVHVADPGVATDNAA